MTSEQEAVKLVLNTKVKALLEEAKKADHEIKVEGDYFVVRDRKTFDVVFKGIRIRTDLWGLTLKTLK